MDLGAFLQAGRAYPVLIEAEPGPQSRRVRGAVRARRGRPFWSVAEPLSLGQVLSLTVELAGFRLGPDESILSAGPDDLARLVLAGRVAKCRYFTHLEAYALRLDLMGRVL